MLKNIQMGGGIKYHTPIKTKKGFTLIELLAVIVILAVVALIATPIVLNIIEKANKGAAKTSALNYIKAVETYGMMTKLDKSMTPLKVGENDVVVLNGLIDMKGNKPTAGTITIDENGKVIEARFYTDDYPTTYDGKNIDVREKGDPDAMKFNSTLRVSKTSVFLTYPQTEEIEIIEHTGNGNLNCTTSDESVATCKINGNKVVLTPGKKEGQTTITLASQENSKYKEAKIAILASTEKGLLSVTANGYDGVYDGESHGITVSSSDATIKYGTEEGTYNLDASPKYSNVGEYTVYYEISKEGYKTIKGSKTVKITKASGSVTAPTAKTLTYTGSAQELVNAGSSTTGTIQYKLGSGSYMASIPKETNAGTYTVYYKVIGDSNHNDVAEKSINVTIEKANNKLTLSSNTGTVTYPNSTTFEVTENTSGGSLSCTSSDTASATCSISGNTVTVTAGKKEATSTTITVTSSATSGYKEASASYVVTSENGILSVSANGYSGVYDGQEHGITVTSSGSTIKYGTSSGTYNLDASPKYKDIGTYTVYYQVIKEGYKTVTGSKTITITEVVATGVSLNKTSATIDKGSTLQLSATINPSNTTNKTLTWTSSNTSVATVSSSGLVTAKAAGSATITVKTSNNKSATCTITVIAYTGVSNTTYSTNSTITYQGISFLVVNDNGDTVTLVTSSDVGTGQYGSNTTFSGSTAYNYVNTTWVNANSGIKTEIEKGGIITDSTTNSKVRLLTTSEVSGKNNGTGNAFWTMTASGSNMYYAKSNGSTSYSYVSGSSLTSTSTVASPTSTTGRVDDTYTSQTSTSLKVKHSGFCTTSEENRGCTTDDHEIGERPIVMCKCPKTTTTYSLTNTNTKPIGYRPVITVKKK